MFRNYLRVAFRNLWRHRVFSGINLLGLAVGMASFLLISRYVSFESSYDAFNTKADRIYRINCDTKTETEVIHTGVTAGAHGPSIKANFPEVEQQVRVCFAGFLVQNGEKRFQENNIIAADSTLFEVFSLPFVNGNAATALQHPFDAVLSEDGAKKYFGSADPVGQALLFDGKYRVRITGVIRNIPQNAQFRGDIILALSSFTSLDKNYGRSWGNFNWFTYLLLKPGTNAARLQAELKPFVNKQAEDITKSIGMSYTLFLQPLTAVHLGPQLNNYGIGDPTGSKANVNIFSIVAAFILLIACINFVNLTTARAAERAREVGIRKAIGAVRAQLTIQFLGESILLCVIAFGLAVGLCNILHPVFTQLLDKNIPLNNSHGDYLLELLGIALGIGVIAGAYPALIMSGFNPIAVLKGRFVSTKNGFAMRRVLVVFQFTISTALIIGTLVVYNQLRYMQSQDLGFNKDQTVAINFYGDSVVQANQERLRQELAAIPNVNGVTFSSNEPGTAPNNWYFQVANPAGKLQGINLNFYVVDFDYFPKYKINLAAGRAFSRAYPTDSTKAIIINEAAARSLGYVHPTAALGKKYNIWGVDGTIVGIAKDFHYRSLQETIQPLGFRVMNPGFYSIISVGIAGNHIPGTLAALEKKWQQLVPNRPFDYSFVDRDFAKLYSSEDRFQRVFMYFGLLAIFISSLGLLGLAAYSTIQRTKEIGIRKVMGASVATIVGLLSMEFLRLVFIALLIASPIAWFAMHSWLQGFAYRTDIAWWVFPLSAGAAVLITFLTVGFHAVKAAVADPVKSLRAE
ncbi:ABC transporter permease [Puia sp.]|uniref:ABC transporter permease n=1 Tax=Puia sp. TaxID=2045100 RepID=UPI002F40BA7D